MFQLRSFVKGVLTGTLLGALARTVFKPSRKPIYKEIMDRAEELPVGKKTGKIIKGMTKSVDRMMK